MLKRILIISVIFFIIAAAIGVYVVFLRNNDTGPALVEETGQTSPFGPNSGNRPDSEVGGIGGVVSPGGTIPIEELTLISTEPVSGSTIITTKEGPVIRFAEKAASHVTDVHLTTGTTTRVTNTTIPKIHESLWALKGEQVLLRYIDDDGESIQTYSARIATSTALNNPNPGLRELKGVYLSRDIKNIAVAPSGKSIFYFVPQGNIIGGIISDPDGSKRVQIFESPHTGWIPSWPAEGTLLITTKATTRAAGFSYFLTSKGALKKVLGNIKGLTAIANQSLTKVAYSNNNNELAVLNIKPGTITNIPLRTLAEKCVWSKTRTNILYCAVPVGIPQGEYPDSWYQGLVSFSDSIYWIDTDTGDAALITNIQATYGKNIDAINLNLSEGESYLTFMNKKDSLLWSLKLDTVGTSTPR